MFGQENLFNSVTFPHNSYFGRLPGEDFLSLDRPLHAHHHQLQQQQQQHPAYAQQPPPSSSELYVPFGTTTNTRYDLSSSSMLPTDPYNFRRMSADTQASTDSSSVDQKPSAALDKNVFLPPIHTLANPSEPSPPASLRPASPADSYSPAKASPPSVSGTWHHPAHQNLSTFQFPALDGPESARGTRPQLSLDHHQRAYPSSAAGAGPTAAGAPFAPPTPASSTTYGNPFSPPQQRISGHAPRVAHRPDDAYEQLMLAPGDMPSNNSYSPSVAVRPAPVAPSQQPPAAPGGPMGAPQPGQGPAHMMPPLAAATQQRRRGKLPKPVTEFLKKWLLAHTDHPYPTEDEKKWLCSETGLSMSQVSNWMINARRRILAPAAKANAAAAAAAAANGNGAFYNRGSAIRTVSGSSSVPDNNAALPVYLPNAYNLPAPQGGRRGSYSTYSPAGPNGPRQVPPLSTQYNMLPSPGGQFTPSASSATSSSYGYFPPSAQSAGQGVYPTTGSLGPATFGNGTSEGHQGSPNGTPPADFGGSSTFAPPPPQQS